MSSTKSGIYICIEGLDGSGKSTVISSLKKELKSEGINIDVISPTKVLEKNKNKFLEKTYKNISFFSKSRIYRAFLYADRSNNATKATNWNADLILGDRSIITSYVVSWSNIKLLNKLKFFRVDLLERKIYAPDHVIFIDVSYNKLNERLNTRSDKRDIDETFERSRKMKKAYISFMKNNYIKRIKDVKWHVINGDDSKEVVLVNVKKLALEILKNIN
jgi:thymidylate kinase